MATLAELGPAEKIKVGNMIRNLIEKGTQLEKASAETELLKAAHERDLREQSKALKRFEMENQKLLSKLVQSYGMLRIYQDRLRALELEKEEYVRKVGRLEALLTSQQPSYFVAATVAAACAAPSPPPPPPPPSEPIMPPRLFPEVVEVPLQPPPTSPTKHIFYDPPEEVGREEDGEEGAGQEKRDAEPVGTPPPHHAPGRPPLHPGPPTPRSPVRHVIGRDSALDSSRFAHNLSDLVHDVERMMDRCLRDLQRPLDESQARSSAIPSVSSSPARSQHHTTSTFSVHSTPGRRGGEQLALSTFRNPSPIPPLKATSVEDALFELERPRGLETSLQLQADGRSSSKLGAGSAPPRHETDLLALLDELEQEN